MAIGVQPASLKALKIKHMYSSVTIIPPGINSNHLLLLKMPTHSRPFQDPPFDLKCIMGKDGLHNAMLLFDGLQQDCLVSPIQMYLSNHSFALTPLCCLQCMQCQFESASYKMHINFNFHHITYMFKGFKLKSISLLFKDLKIQTNSLGFKCFQNGNPVLEAHICGFCWRNDEAAVINTTHPKPSPNLSRASCQYSWTNPVSKVITDQKIMHAERRFLRL